MRTPWAELRPHLRRESDRFVDVLAAVDPAARVPSCPDWSAADLVWHLAEVQLFWAGIVRGRVQDGSGLEAVEAAKPARPQTYSDLLDLARVAGAQLVEALDEGSDDDPLWSWSADRSVGFARRRQVHEALVHRVDAELTAGLGSTLDPALAADGVDEVLALFWSGGPSWATVAPVGGTVELVTTDVGRAWRVQPSRFTGTSPTSGRTYDEAAAELVGAAATEPVARVEATAADLDRWVWGRGGTVSTSGDADALARVAEVVDDGIQ